MYNKYQNTWLDETEEERDPNYKWRDMPQPPPKKDAVQEWFDKCSGIRYELKDQWGLNHGPFDIHLDSKYEGFHDQRGESFSFLKLTFSKYYMLYKYAMDNGGIKLHTNDGKLFIETDKLKLTMEFE